VSVGCFINIDALQCMAVPYLDWMLDDIGGNDARARESGWTAIAELLMFPHTWVWSASAASTMVTESAGTGTKCMSKFKIKQNELTLSLPFGGVLVE
jgi:hypothetical protein